MRPRGRHLSIIRRPPIFHVVALDKDFVKLRYHRFGGHFWFKLPDLPDIFPARRVCHMCAFQGQLADQLAEQVLAPKEQHSECVLLDIRQQIVSVLRQALV